MKSSGDPSGFSQSTLGPKFLFWLLVSHFGKCFPVKAITQACLIKHTHHTAILACVLYPRCILPFEQREQIIHCSTLYIVIVVLVSGVSKQCAKVSQVLRSCLFAGRTACWTRPQISNPLNSSQKPPPVDFHAPRHTLHAQREAPEPSRQLVEVQVYWPQIL